jgi:cell wall-associated NlpC family hydrolase
LSGRALICCLAIALALGADAQAAAAPPPTGHSEGWSSGQEKALGVIGRTTLTTAIAATDSRPAMDAFLDSLALLSAAYENPEGPGDRPAKPPRADPPTPSAVKEDPASIPPASAGSNGTKIPLADRESAKRLAAHSPASEPGAAGPTSILLTGIALAPPQAPEAIKAVINAANTIVGRPYIWGGGHGSWYSTGYDCSGSVSFALHGGGLIPKPLSSGELARWGAPGPGRWLTVYANPGHVFAVVAGLRWDTVGDASGTGPRWHLLRADPKGFVARHVPGY